MTDLPISGTQRDDAIARAERIRAGIRSLAELQQDITDAYQARDWTTLGYDTWDAYVSGEFGNALPRLDRQERRELVVNLRAEGLSTRAIASATGTDQSTVSRDLSGDAFASPEPDTKPEPAPDPPPVTGRDGKTHQPAPPAAETNTTEENGQQETTVPSTQNAKKRRAITDTTYETARQLAKDAGKLSRLLDDERLSKNREQVATACYDDLTRASALIADAMNQLHIGEYSNE